VSKKEFLIQRYCEADIPEMIASIKQFMQEKREDGYVNHYADIDFCEEKLYSLLTSNLDNVEFFTNIVRDESGKIVGGLCGYVTEYVFSYERVAVEQLLYFDPAQSNVKTLLELLKTFIEWAERRKVREVQIHTSTGFKPEKFALLMKRCNFQQFAVGFSRRL
jgi:hypothetical protein